MSERFIGRVAQVVLAGALAASCTPHQRSEMVNPVLTGSSSGTPQAQSPDSFRSQLICGPDEQPYRDWTGQTTDGGGQNLFRVAQELGQDEIDWNVGQGQDPQKELELLRGHGTVMLGGENVSNYGDLENKATQEPSAIPTVASQEEVKVHILFCGPRDPNSLEPHP